MKTPLTLYLSPLTLSDLAEIFPDTFDIKLLICDPMKNLYVSETNESPCFKELNKRADIATIIRTVEKNKIYIYEYHLTAPDFEIESVNSGGNDLLIRFKNKQAMDRYSQKLLDKWSSITGYNNLTVLEPGILYSFKDKNPVEVLRPSLVDNMVDFLIEELETEVVKTGNYDFKNRIYYVN